MISMLSPPSGFGQALELPAQPLPFMAIIDLVRALPLGKDLPICAVIVGLAHRCDGRPRGLEGLGFLRVVCAAVGSVMMVLLLVCDTRLVGAAMGPQPWGLRKHVQTKAQMVAMYELQWGRSLGSCGNGRMTMSP
jgi:hypothetical protein